MSNKPEELERLESYVPGIKRKLYRTVRRELRSVDPKVRGDLLTIARKYCKQPKPIEIEEPPEVTHGS